MGQITREEAIDIAININSLFNIEITDQWDARWPVYAADSFADCWYITFTPCFNGREIGPTGLIAVSKESGNIRYTTKLAKGNNVESLIA